MPKDTLARLPPLSLSPSHTHTHTLYHQEDEHEDGEDLCNCEFSLGYGAKILLNNTRLHLKRGKRYGVCGHNGCGKSTLMKAIANGQVENFPQKTSPLPTQSIAL